MELVAPFVAPASGDFVEPAKCSVRRMQSEKEKIRLPGISVVAVAIQGLKRRDPVLVVTS